MTSAYPSPVGRLTLVASDAGLRAVLWDADLDRRVPLDAELSEDNAHPVLTATAEQLGAYFAGRRSGFDLPLDLRGTPFQLRAWCALTTIPFGETRSYAAQARALGLRASAARAVGAANARNPVSIVVPCHRLVGTRGALTGFAGGLDAKRTLLAHEREHASRATR